MNKPVHNTLGAERRKARHYGMQALYQWLMASAPLSDIEVEFRADYDFSHVDLEYFQALLHEIPARVCWTRPPDNCARSKSTRHPDA